MRYPLDQIRLRQNQFGVYNPTSNSFGNVRSGGRRPHQGWDLEAPVGTSTYAITAGTIETRTSDSYGLCATLEFLYNGQTYYAFYAHLSEQTISSGSVMEGAIIGKTGISGNARSIPIAEAHLHFEIRTVKNPGRGLTGRIDPAEIYGYEVYSSHTAPIDGTRVPGILR